MKEKRHLSEKTAEKTSRAKPAGRFRLLVQAAWFAVTNGYAAGFLEKRIYTGKLKRLCVPGLNCYSCPGALASCPIGSLQAVLSSSEFTFSCYVLGFLMLFGTVLGRLVCGWLCPFGLFQDLLHKIPFPGKRKNLPGHRFLRQLKYVILVLFVILLPSAVAGITGNGEPWFCKYICPSGTLMGGIPLALGNPLLRSAIGTLFSWKMFLLILTVAGGILIYQNSYSGQLRQGYQALEAGNYDDALARFQRAVSRDEERPEAYTGMSQVYIEQDNLDQAEQVFLDALEGQDSNTELYRAAITFYLDTSQEQKVSELLENCSSDRVLRELAQYVSEPPEFSLDEDEVYEDVQALELTGSGTAIYYTTDGSEPDTSSTKYTEPITLNEETTVVKAISVNEEGIPSVTVEKTFQIEFPAIAAPNVTPSTGQYSTSQTIEVEQLEDYEIRYTTDGTMPDSGSELYTGPIDMPEGSTVFTFVYIDKSGRVSQSTTRSYELVY